MQTKNNYLIRSMQTADLSAVLLIEQTQKSSWTLQKFADCLAANYLCWVLEHNNEVIGFVILSFIDEQAELLNIAIKKEFRSQQLGKYLLTAILQKAKISGVKEIFLEVRESNTVAINLYEKCGFKVINIRQAYYLVAQGARENALVMRYEF